MKTPTTDNIPAWDRPSGLAVAALAVAALAAATTLALSNSRTGETAAAPAEVAAIIVSALTGTGMMPISPDTLSGPGLLALIGLASVGAITTAAIASWAVLNVARIGHRRWSFAKVSMGVAGWLTGLAVIGTGLAWLTGGGSLSDSALWAVNVISHAGLPPRVDADWARSGDAVPGIVQTVLILASGAGYPLWCVATAWVVGRLKSDNARRYVKMAVVVVLVVSVGGAVLVGVGQALPQMYRYVPGLGQTANRVDASSDVWRAAGEAGFHAIAAPSAGLIAMPSEGLTPTTRLVTMLLQALGGLPGGPGGGVGLLGFALVAAAVRRGATARWVAALATVMLTLIFVTTWALALSESLPVADMLGAAVAAVTAAGGGQGAQGLTAPGWGVLSAAMLAGRVIPLVMLVTMAGRLRQPGATRAPAIDPTDRQTAGLRRAWLALVGCVAGLVALGGLLLALPAAQIPGSGVDGVDAVFAAAGAVCNAALHNGPVNQRFTPFGRSVLYALMQAGALAQATLGTVIFARFMIRLKIGPTHFWKNLTVRRIVGLAAVGLIGLQALVAIAILPGVESGGAGRVVPAAFAAASVVTHTGFTIEGVEFTATGWTSHLAVVPITLIVSLGVPVAAAMGDPSGRAWASRMIAATAAVYVIGVAGLFASIWLAAGWSTNAMTAAAEAGFLAATRTSGLADAEQMSLTGAGRVFLTGWMAIGAAPGAMVSGVGMLAVAMVWPRWASKARRRRCAGVALGLAAMAVILPMIAAVLLSAVEPVPVDVLLFESVSAASGSGLSLGDATRLTTFGRCVLIGTLVVGRVGWLGVLAWWAWRED